ncbi:hypothetical protein IJT17_05400 [bacterium]|nr:hypothetical protein [bacterium]
MGLFGDNKKEEFEKLFFEMLDTPEAQRKIKDIIQPKLNQQYININNRIDNLNNQMNALNSDQSSRQGNDPQNNYGHATSYSNATENMYLSTINELKKENSKLKSDNANLKADKKTAEDNRDDLIKERDDLIKQLERVQSDLTNAKTENHNLTNTFGKPIDLLRRYRELPRHIKDSLSDVISHVDEVHFIASCSSQEHLKAIWDYTKQLIEDGRNADDIEVLKGIFDYFFVIFNESLTTPKFVRDDVAQGDRFNYERHDRCPGSSASGVITEVVLKGYKSANTGNIICKSVVRVQ